MAGLPALPLRRIARPGPRGPGRRPTRGGRPATSRVNTPTRSYTTSDDLTRSATEPDALLGVSGIARRHRRETAVGVGPHTMPAGPTRPCRALATLAASSPPSTS
jgi:hypothetical protein